MKMTVKLLCVLFTFLVIAAHLSACVPEEEMPAFYDAMLTVRNVQDVETFEMLDMIFFNRTYDTPIYFESLGFANPFASSVLSKGVDFISAYKAENRTFDKRGAGILRKLRKTESYSAVPLYLTPISRLTASNMGAGSSQRTKNTQFPSAATRPPAATSPHSLPTNPRARVSSRPRQRAATVRAVSPSAQRKTPSSKG